MIYCPLISVVSDVIDKDPPHVLRRHVIHQPMVKRAYAECTLLYQPLKLINIIKIDPTDTVLCKIVETVNPISNCHTTSKSHS